MKLLNFEMDNSVTLELVVATPFNTKHLGWMISDDVSAFDESEKIDIPFYKTVREGANFAMADWKDQACVRQAIIDWRDDHNVNWLERHMEMTQGFIVLGKNPGLFVFGEPTHDRDDLSPEARNIPDITRTKAYIVPGGAGIIIKKGTWHDFPVSCGPSVHAFVINTKEVVAALASMKSPAPMNHGDCYKLSVPQVFPFAIKFPDPRPFVISKGFVADTSSRLNGAEGYGEGMSRRELGSWNNDTEASLFIIPIVNVEVFVPGAGGPSIQPHLCSQPELANSGWRDYGNNCGLERLIRMTQKLGISATAVVNSDALKSESIVQLLAGSGWDVGGHGRNNSQGLAHLCAADEEGVIRECFSDLVTATHVQPSAWLTPGFSVTKQTPRLCAAAGFDVLLDYVCDDVAFQLVDEAGAAKILCVPYSMETNDFSLVLGRHFCPSQYASALESHINQLVEETKLPSSSPKVLCLGMHTFVAGTPGNVFELSKMLERVKVIPGVKFVSVKDFYNRVNGK